MPNRPLYTETASRLSQLLDADEVSSRQIMESYIAHTSAIDDKIKAFIHRDEADALKQADASDKRRQAGETLGPLDGIPVGLKDILACKGQPLTCASRMLENFVSPYDATSVSQLKAAGAITWGRLNMDEFAMGSSTEHSSRQLTHNPWDLERIPGGSSGGSAACVAAREAPLALGTDTGGSIRQPAAHCGIVGLKPTYGLVSRYGLVAYASSLDQAGPMAQTVEDCSLLLQAIAGHDPLDSTSYPADIPDYTKALSESDKPRKLGIPKEFFDTGLDPEVKAAVQKSIQWYESQGCSIEAISLPHTELAIPVYYIIAPAEASSNLARYDGIRYTHRSENFKDVIDLYFKSRAEGFGPEVKLRILIGTYVLSSGYYDAYYKKAQKIRALIRNDFMEAFKKVDAIITPTSPTPAFKIGDKTADPLAMYLSDAYTLSVNLAGLPALSVPCGFTASQLPIGMQIIGKPFEESSLLAIANCFDKAHQYGCQVPESIKPTS